MTRLADRALGVSLAAGAWVFAIATYPAALAYAYSIRDAAAAFDASLEELAARPLPCRDRQERAS